MDYVTMYPPKYKFLTPFKWEKRKEQNIFSNMFKMQ